MRYDFYVYVSFRLDGRPCYVGKGRGNRWLNYKRRKDHNPHLWNIIQAAGGRIPTVKIHEGLTESEAFATEVALIAAIGREVDGGPLVNLTGGGDGAADPSPEVRAKNSAQAKARHTTKEWRANHGKRMKAVASDPAWRRNQSIKASEIAADLAWRENRSKSQLAIGADPAWREHHSAKMVALYADDPQRGLRHSEYMRQLYASDPNRGLEYGAKMRAMWADPLFREKMRSRRDANPEVTARRLAAWVERKRQKKLNQTWLAWNGFVEGTEYGADTLESFQSQ